MSQDRKALKENVDEIQKSKKIINKSYNLTQ